MVTDRYQHVHHHSTVEEFSVWAKAENIAILGVDNIENAVPIETTKLPEQCVLVFGQEGPGLSEDMVSRCELVLEITQYGSTRSINAGVASGIAMYEWLSQNSQRSCA
tara:strand:- start:398 stop:721 length:324 start_codon:yes stop_codon:yes gene_type:complete